MTIAVIQEKSQVNDRQGRIVIQADTQEEAHSPAARAAALKAAAAAGLPRPGLSGNDSAYPVDADGNTSEDLVMGRGGAVAGYRCDYSVTGGL